MVDRHVPSHASREILILFGGLATCDPGNIIDTVKVSFIAFTRDINIVFLPNRLLVFENRF